MLMITFGYVFITDFLGYVPTSDQNIVKNNQLSQFHDINTKVRVAAFRLGWKWLSIYKAAPNDE